MKLHCHLEERRQKYVLTLPTNTKGFNKRTSLEAPAFVVTSFHSESYEMSLAQSGDRKLRVLA
jgi:hypothetical protein